MAALLRAAADTVAPNADPFEGAPWDDEPLTPEDEAALAKAEEDVRAGRVRPWHEVKRELGL